MAVVATDDVVRRRLVAALGQVPGAEVVAWAEHVALLFVLGTRMDICVCADPTPAPTAVRLRERGAALVALAPEADPRAALRAELAREGVPSAGIRRPRLAPRQLDVLVAYVGGSDLLPTVARDLGMDRETLKTHLRRIRTKYAEVGRPAPTRRDLYVRAVEDGLVPPPSESHAHGDAPSATRP